MMANFSELPKELIDIVMKALSLVEDFVASGIVCKSWQSIFSAAIHNNRKFSPWLMLTNDETDAQNLRSFSSLSSKKEFTIEVADIHGRRCWGSPFGWLVTFGLDLAIHLLNPLSGVRLSLPHQSTVKLQYQTQPDPEFMRDVCPRRLLLSSNPSDPSCIVVAIFDPDGKLYFARIGDEVWTPIETPGMWYSDAIFFNGQIVAVNCSRLLTVCDITGPSPKGAPIESSPSPNSSNVEYLVEVCGELHLLLRHSKSIVHPSYSLCYEATVGFTVYKFDFQTKIWSEVSDLGDNALFVGSNTSFVLSTLDYPEFRRNAIYYSDDYSSHFRSNFCDMSIYNLETKTIEPFYSGSNVLSKFSRPLFLIPSLS